MSLKGKVAIVTGGNSGIGKAIVLELAEQGANIVIDYVANPKRPRSWRSRSPRLGDQAIGVEADVSKVEDLQKLIDTAVEQFGRIDIMVNNAGVETRTSVLDTTEAQYEKVLEINLKSAFFGTQLAAKQMIKQGGGGRIINITSVHEDWPMPGNTAYCLSKGGHAHAHPHRRRRARRRTTSSSSASARARSRRRSTLDHERPGADEDARRRHPARPHGQAGGDRQRGGVPGRRRAPATSPRPRSSPTAASCTRARVCRSPPWPCACHRSRRSRTTPSCPTATPRP